MKRLTHIVLALSLLLSALSPSATAATKAHDFIWACHNGLAQYEDNGKIGLLDAEGNVVLEAAFDEINPCFHNGYTWVIINGLYGLIDENGNVMIEPQYKYIEQVESGLVCAQDKKTKLFGYTDVNGNWVVEPAYTVAQPFCGEIAIAYIGPESELIQHAIVLNTQGEIVNDLGTVWWLGSHSSAPYNKVRVRDDINYPNFARGDAFGYDMATFDNQTMEGIGILDEQGQIVDCSKLDIDSHTITAGYYHFSDGLMLVARKSGDYNLYGFMNRSGEMVIEPQYYRALPFYKGKAYVTDEPNSSPNIDSKYFHFIDTQGNDCGRDGLLGGNGIWSLEYGNNQLPVSDTDKFAKKGYFWGSNTPASENVFIFIKFKQSEKYNGGEMVRFNTSNINPTAFAYVNIHTMEILYENTFGVQRTDFGCGLYKVMDSKGRIGYINEKGELVSGLKKKGQ